MKKRVFGAVVVLLLILLCGAIGDAYAYGQSLDQTLPEEPIHPQYSYTDQITASLLFENGKAVCKGVVRPSGNYDCSITVTLYKQNGAKWDYITSYYGSATDGGQASAKGSITVENGTYKVVASGYVENKEYPSKSVTRTKK